MRGAKKDVQLSDYRGKWVVLEFWNLSCKICLKRNLPAWSEFYTAHAAQRDRFEIVSICVDVDEDLGSIADVERRLQPIVKHVWQGRDLPFPMLLDSGLRTWQSYGLDYMARTLLVDPAGNLTDVIGHDEVRDHLLRSLERAN
jgi:peroxiredoxin